MEHSCCLLSQKPFVTEAVSVLDKWISLLAVSVTSRSKELLLQLLVASPKMTSLSVELLRRKFQVTRIKQAHCGAGAEAGGGGRGRGAVEEKFEEKEEEEAEEEEEEEEQQQPQKQQIKHCSSCSSDWLDGSAASLEQKVKVDCSVNVESQSIT